ncbi:MAG: peptidoglycan DD-metalloendopeptidase family protein [Flavobacteriaceae bacterium]|nr:peptidoglycan DD-metalloendopeptidase family protein [Flavobacteriaceae bacterium]
MIAQQQFTYKNLFVLLGLFFALTLQAQSKKQKALEEKRQQYKKELKQLNALLFQGKQEQKSVLVNVENLNYKVTVRQNLIGITNQQANLLTKEINANQKQISKHRDKLKLLKEAYAEMLVKSYKNKSEQSKVMFLLSSSNFQQAYKRLQYIKQYAEHQKQQSEAIKAETLELQKLNTSLLAQKKDKQKLINENRLAKTKLETELKAQEDLEAAIKKNLKKHLASIRQTQQEIDKLDKEIEKIIRAAMLSSNKKAGKSATSKTFALTPEQKKLASNFIANKGKLPWPVKEGAVKVRYGTRPSPIDRTVKIKSNGVRIATNKDETVRAVFDGVVHTIMTPKNGNMVVMIQHGNYFSVYKNMSKIYVKKGDRVSTKEDIGKVLMSKSTKESILGFYIYKNGKPQNPAQWVFKL